MSAIGALALFNMIAQRPWVGNYDNRFGPSSTDPHPDTPDQWDVPGENLKEYSVNPAFKKKSNDKPKGVNLHNSATAKSGNHWKG